MRLLRLLDFWPFSTGKESKADISKTRHLVISGVLYAPASFLIPKVAELLKVINGCGAANSKFDFVPDTIYGLYIGAACKIHDWMYHEGRSIEDKEEADRVFFNNLLRIILRSKKKWYRPKILMRRRAKSYYKLVKSFGGPAFWSGKN